MVEHDARENGTRKLPRPSLRVWRRAWLRFERVLDPLGLPRPLPLHHVRRRRRSKPARND